MPNPFLIKPAIKFGSSIIKSLRGTPSKPKTKSPFTVQSGATNSTSYSLPSTSPRIGLSASRTTPTQAAASSKVAPEDLVIGGFQDVVNPIKTPPQIGVAATAKKTTDPTSNFSMQGYQTNDPDLQARIKAKSLQAEQNSLVQRASKPEVATAQDTPQIPQTVQSNGKSILDALRNKVSSLSAPSDEEKRLQDELTQFQGAAKQSIAGLEGQGRGISVDLVRGQQAKLQEQTDLQEQTLLERLSAASANRQAQLTAAQNEYETASAEQERQDAITAPQQVGNSIIQFDPATGTYKTLYSAPSGGTDLPSIAQEYEYAKQNGYNGSFMDYQNETGSSSSGTADMSATESRNLGFYNRAQAAEADIQKSLPNVGNLVQGVLPNFAQGKDYQQYEQAARTWIAAILRQESGAAIPPDEMKSYMRTYFPQVGDREDTIRQKEKARAEAIKALNVSGLGSEPSGGDDIDQWLNSFSNDLSMSRNGSTWGNLGSLSEKYESGGNPGAIGYDSTGGYSYGTYQLAHSNAQKFVEQSPFKTAFAGLKFNTKEWQNKWKEVAQKAPQQFAQAQKEYIAKTHFEPQVEKLKKSGINVASLPQVVQDAIWSTAVQHGANTDVVTKALATVGKNAGPADMLKAIYKERWSGGARFASSTPAVKKSVYNRFFGPQGELAMALKKIQPQNIA